MNGAIDELDQKVGVLRESQRQGNQLVGALESSVTAMNTFLEQFTEER